LEKESRNCKNCSIKRLALLLNELGPRFELCRGKSRWIRQARASTEGKCNHNGLKARLSLRLTAQFSESLPKWRLDVVVVNLMSSLISKFNLVRGNSR
jgi:hypothetical protein